MFESLVHDVRYAVRGLRRAPLFAATVAGTIGLGLGLLGAAFTLVNAYLLKPIDLPDPYALYELSWDTETARRRQFRLNDVTALRSDAPHFAGLVAGQQALGTHDGASLTGLLVTGDYFEVLGGRAAMGRLLTADDARAPGTAPVVVLADHVWRSRFGADRAIVGRLIQLGRQRFEVVGVAPPHFGLTGQEGVGFWAPLTMAAAFGGTDPWTEPDAASLFVVGRIKQDATAAQVRAWFDGWIRQRFPPESNDAPVAVRVESRATRLPMNSEVVTLVGFIVAAFALVLLVACANVTNLLLARAVGRQPEIAVRLSLGASRRRVARQLIVEGLVLAVPAAAIGLALTQAIARAFPALVLATFPPDLLPIEVVLVPLETDARVLTMLAAAAIASAVLVSALPASRATRTDLVRASRGEVTLDGRGSRFRAALVAVQIGACVIFLIGAAGFIDESRRLANTDPVLEYERVAELRVAPRLQPAVAARLAADPQVERVAAAWRPPMSGELRQVTVRTSATSLEQNTGFLGVSPDYFDLFDIRIVRGRVFTADEARGNAPVALVSEATARTLWPGSDPIGQTLELLPPRTRTADRRPEHTTVRVIGVTEDVVSGMLLNGIDRTCVYFPTAIESAGEAALLVRSRNDAESLRPVVAGAVDTVEADAPFRLVSFRALVGGLAWVLHALSTVASLLGIVGLLLAFSGTYAVVSFVVARRTREFGVRMALGATVRQIVQGIMVESSRTAAIGVVAGALISASLIRLFGSAIPLTPAFGAGHFAAAAAVVLAATLAATLLPSARTARIEPSHALRAE